MPSRIFAVFFCVILAGLGGSVVGDQPSIQVRNGGHLVIQPAAERNVTVRLSRNSVLLLNGVNVVETLEKRLRRATGGEAEPEESDLTEALASLRRDLLRVRGSVTLLQRRNPIRQGRQRERRLTTRTFRLMEAVDVMMANLQADQCSSNPCKNGGSCYNAYKRFHCDCMEGWTGDTCSDDVDECYMLSGTKLGCQNGGVCVNSLGSYRCVCPDGYNGEHCRSKSHSCGSGSDVCGHGLCVPARSEPGYTCICDQGWTKSNTTLACLIDVNECDTGAANPCHGECINLPGSFKCGPCPSGYTGDGVNCFDIDECGEENGGCSNQPPVRCFNTPGSYHCGQCPFGWTGDGRKCELVPSNSCDSHNICHPRARCEYISEAAVCTCPVGMYGHGFGPEGCTAEATAHPCETHQCQNNGSCAVVGGRGTRCICQTGFMGARCELPDACQTAPCQNGGTCHLLPGNKYRCTCLPGSTGTDCQVQRQICGTNIRRLAGDISYPPELDGADSSPSSYHVDERCAWLIRTNASMLIDLNFTAFDVEFSPDCNKDWLQIHDGRTLASPLIGRFCGQTLPAGGHIRSSNEYLFFWFRSDNATNGAGFRMSWTSVPNTCGEQLSVDLGSYGVIQSPGYPGMAPTSKRCFWKLNAAWGQRFVFRFYEVSLGQVVWSNDSLVIYDSDRELRRMLPDSSLEPLHTSSNMAEVHFHTNPYQTQSRFQLHYEVVPGIPHCGGLFTEPSGTITGYTDAELCLYLIEQPPGLKIKLEFVDFKLLATTDCALHRLEIYDGRSAEAPLMKRLCSTDTLEPLISTGNTMMLRYEYALHGIKISSYFTLKYSRVCDQEFSDIVSGIATTPNYPNGYLDYITCTYTFEAPLDHVVMLNITDFSITSPIKDPEAKALSLAEQISVNATQQTYVDIQLNSENATRYAELETPFVLYSERNRMRVVFHGAANTQKGRGIRFEYTAVPMKCGGVLTRNMAILSYLSTEPQLCQWIFEAPENKIIEMEITVIPDLKYVFNQKLEKRLLFVYANGTKDGGQLLDSFISVSEFKANYFTNRITVMLKQETSESILVRLASKFVDSSRVCGGNSTASYGVIKSPGWPRSYGHSMNCSWVITAPLGTKLELSVHNFSLEENCWDMLQIRNGHTADSPLIGTYCGKSIPATIPSLTNSLFVYFESDELLSAEGFYLTWHQTETGCGGKLSSYEGSIHPPHRSETDFRIAACDWQINVAQGSRIELNFVSRTGSVDYLMAYDGPMTSSPRLNVDWQRGDVAEPSEGQVASVTTSGNQALLVLQMMWFQSSDFVVTYRTLCGSEFSSVQGVIESPNFPEDYPPGLHCRWDIRGGRNNRIDLAFSHFNIEQKNLTCDYDYVEIVDIRNDEELSRRRVCSMPSQVLTSTGNRLVVTFVTDYSDARSGFRAEFRRVGCGGQLNNLAGTINTPNAPYSVDMECDWVIEVPAGRRIQLEFSELQLDTDQSDCRDMIFVSKDNRNGSLPLLKVCHTEEKLPARITSPANRVFISFRSSETRARKYFKASYFTVTSQCGGAHSGRAGVITSPDYPEKYATNVECVWSISVEETYGVRLKFQHFNMTPSENCEEASLTLRSAKQYGFQKKLCGGNLPDSFTVIGSEVTVTFAAGSSGYGQFELSYEKECGGNLTDSVGFIRGRSDEECVWVLNAPEATEIGINLLQFDCACVNTTSCKNSLKIYEAEDNAMYQDLCTDAPQFILLPRNSLRIVASYVSLYARYSTLQNSCGGNITSTSGNLASPRFPDSYPPGISCEWQIQAPRGSYISFQFRNLDIAASEYCNGDFLEMREAGSGGPFVGLYCSSQMPVDELKVFEVLWIKFRSVAGSTGAGFSLTWQFERNSEVNATSGVIESPRIFRQFEDPYTWRLMTDQKKQITLDFVEYNGGLKLYDGYTEEALQVDIEKSPWTFVSSANVVYLRSSVEELPDFRIEWRATQQEAVAWQPKCGYNMTVDSGHLVGITSPGYPKAYEADTDCVWFLKPPNDQDHVEFLLSNSDMEQYDSTCAADYLSVSSSPNMRDWQEVLRACNNKSNVQVAGKPYLKLQFHADSSVQGIGFGGVARAVCGSNMTASVGTISLANYPPASRSATCEWHIDVRPGRSIEFTLDFGELAETTAASAKGDCPDAYSLIYDGLDTSANIMQPGRLCNRPGHNVRSLRTTSNHAFIKYVDLTPFKDKLWNFTYREYSECNNELRLTHSARSVNISSPQYPNVPQPHTECSWTFVAPPGETLVARFVDRFSMTWTKCSQEYVELYDGTTALARTLGHYCVKTTQAIRTSGNVLYVRYLTDVAEPRMGFRLNVALATCGGTFATLMGSFTSPNYPHPSGSQLCEYTIRLAPNRGSIQLNFTDISLPFDFAQSQEKRDRIEVLALDANRTSLAVFYGDGRNNPILDVEGNEVMVRYYSYQLDPSQRGFKVVYRSSLPSCFKDVEGESGTLTFTNPFSGFQMCQWKIVVPKGQRVRFKFQAMEGVSVPNGANYSLTPPLFTFYNGNRMQSKITELRYNDINDTTEVLSTDNLMYIRIAVGYAVYKLTHLEAYYSSEDPSPCPPEIDASPHGQITLDSLRDLDTYYCAIRFRVNSDKETIAFDFKQLEYSNETASDRRTSVPNTWPVRIVDISDEFQMFAANLGQPNFVVTSTSGSLVAVQTQRRQIRAFVAEYRRFPCGGVFALQDGVSLRMPQVQDQGTANGRLDCSWALSGTGFQQTYKVRANFSFAEPCDREYLVLYDRNWREMKRLCGESTADSVVEVKPRMRLAYHTEVYRPGRSHFQLTFEQAMKCGGARHLEMANTAPKVTLTSAQYRNNMECSWTFDTEEGFFLSVNFVDRFFVEVSPNCSKDHLELQTFEAGLWQPSQRFCGRNLPPPVNTTAARLRLVFRTDNATVGDGFAFEVTRRCGASVNVTAEGGKLQVPSGYQQGLLHCEYVFQSSANQLFSVSIQMARGGAFFKLRGQRACSISGFTLYRQDGLGELMEQGHYCQPIEFTDRKYIKLVYDSRIPRRFTLAYKLNTCGGNFTEPRTITSPKDPDFDAYMNDMHCVWTFVGPPDHSVALRFEYAELEQSCMDYVSVYEGRSLHDDKRLVRLCDRPIGDKEPLTLMSDSNVVTVVAVSDGSLQYRGFRAQVFFTRNCNERITLTEDMSAVTLSRHFEVTAGETLLCHYNVMAPVGYRVKTVLRELQANGPACRDVLSCNTACNYVEVLNSAVDGAASLGKLCTNGHRSMAFMSTFSDAVLVFSASESGNWSFEVGLQMEPNDCGQQTDIRLQEDEVFSLSYPWKGSNASVRALNNNSSAIVNYPANAHCKWGIHSPDDVELYFSKAYLQNVSDVTGECLDYIFVESLSMRRYYCGNSTGVRLVGSQYTELTFHSDSTLEAGGFEVTLSPRRYCNLTYTGTSGIMRFYWHKHTKRQCDAEIRVANDQQITVYIKTMISGKRNCTFGSFTVTDIVRNATLMHDCDQNYIVRQLATTSSALRVQIREFSYVNWVYVANPRDNQPGCGGHIQVTEEGFLWNPPYLDDRNASECRWVLEVAAPNRIHITFEQFNMGSKSNCHSDYVTFLESQSDGVDRVVRSFCGSDVPEAFTTRSSRVILLAKKSPNFDGSGWDVNYQVHDEPIEYSPERFNRFTGN